MGGAQLALKASARFRIGLVTLFQQRRETQEAKTAQVDQSPSFGLPIGAMVVLVVDDVMAEGLIDKINNM